MHILKFLDQHGISYRLVEHPPVYTCEEAALHLAGVPGFRTKNLFLRNKKGDRHFLVAVSESKQVDLKALSKLVGADRLGFGSPERLQTHLGISPGAVSLLALVNDRSDAVEVIIDQDVWGAEEIQCHPLVNTATAILPHSGLVKFLNAIGKNYPVHSVPEV